MKKISLQIAAILVFVGIAVAALYYGGVFGNSHNGETSGPGERVAQDVHILKYSDYSCPACKMYVPVQEQLKQEFGENIEIEYRHFPLDSFRHSRLASHAAEAARNQGKFTEMHDLIFEYQSEWSPATANAMEYFTGFAEQIELDMDQFLADLESESVHERVENHRQEGVRRMVNSTPSFFINGHKLQQNPQSYEQFKSIVELYMYRSN
jgi:protein-disulfide isomerase